MMSKVELNCCKLGRTELIERLKDAEEILIYANDKGLLCEDISNAPNSTVEFMIEEYIKKYKIAKNDE